MKTQPKLKLTSITENEYIAFRQLQKDINELIIEKTKVLSIIQRGKLPEGEINDYDFEIEDGKLFVTFESWHCGEPDYETYKLPLEFLFDENYPEKYKTIWQEEVRKKKEETERKLKEQKAEMKRLSEEKELQEYERLKLKFENIKM